MPNWAHPDKDAPLQTCTKCGTRKLASDFYRRPSGHTRGTCRKCQTAQCETSRKKQKPKFAQRMRRLRYGLAHEDFLKMLAAQGGACIICGREALMQVDHCHVTGKIRGLLCSSCNRGLGSFKDSLILVQAAADYLKARQ